MILQVQLITKNDDLADVSDWNKSSQMAVDEITQKYGNQMVSLR
jgi:hypothetical protein